MSSASTGHGGGVSIRMMVSELLGGSGGSGSGDSNHSNAHAVFRRLDAANIHPSIDAMMLETLLREDAFSALVAVGGADDGGGGGADADGDAASRAVCLVGNQWIRYPQQTREAIENLILALPNFLAQFELKHLPTGAIAARRHGNDADVSRIVPLQRFFTCLVESTWHHETFNAADMVVKMLDMHMGSSEKNARERALTVTAAILPPLACVQTVGGVARANPSAATRAFALTRLALSVVTSGDQKLLNRVLASVVVPSAMQDPAASVRSCATGILAKHVVVSNSNRIAVVAKKEVCDAPAKVL